MKYLQLLSILLGFGIAHAAEPGSQKTESCDQIREQIKAQTGIPAKPNTICLARWAPTSNVDLPPPKLIVPPGGDKPMPQGETRNSRRQKHGHDD